jgi:integrase
MPTLRLTAAAIPGLRAKDNGTEQTYRDTLVRGLLLEVHPSGVRTFVAWYRIAGGGDRCGRQKLGRWDPGIYDLADAREDARKVLHLAATGRDPAAERRQARQAGTFGDLAESFLASAQIRESTRTEWGLLLRHARLAGLRARRTTEVTRGELVRLFDKIREDSVREGGKGYSANRTLEAVRRVFSWAVQKDLVGASPCVGVVKPTKEASRRRAYTDAELGAVVRGLGESAMDDAIRLCLYTGVRIEAALGAPWSEFDLDRGTWTIAGERAGTKNGLPWLVPLVPAAVAVLRKREGESTWVFSTRKRKGTGEGKAWRQQAAVYAIRERSGVADFRPHDLRRTLNSWLASRSGGAEPQEVRDAVLGHRPPGLEGVYNVYAYEAEKRSALERWAAHVERITAGQPARVLGFRGVAAP